MLVSGLKKRADFKRLSLSKSKWVSKSFVLVYEPVLDKQSSTSVGYVLDQSVEGTRAALLTDGYSSSLVTNEIGEQELRFGMIVTKKIGCAVRRNRVRRILRVLFRDIFSEFQCIRSLDLLCIARFGILDNDYQYLKSELKFCVAKIQRRINHK